MTSKFDENDEEQAQENENKRSTYCFYHKRTTHATNECEQLQRLSFNERKDFLLKNRLCFNCVNSNQHIARNCNEGKQTCKICQQEHATTLHNPTEHVPPSATERTTSAYANSSSPNQSSRSCARIVLVQVFTRQPFNKSSNIRCFGRPIDGRLRYGFASQPTTSKGSRRQLGSQHYSGDKFNPY